MQGVVGIMTEGWEELGDPQWGGEVAGDNFNENLGPVFSISMYKTIFDNNENSNNRICIIKVHG